MTKVIVGMTVSIDGFAADRNGSARPLATRTSQDLRDTELHAGDVSARPARSSWGNGPSRWGSGFVRRQLRVPGAHLRTDPRASSDDVDLQVASHLQKLTVQEVGARTSLAFRVLKVRPSPGCMRP